MKHISLVAAFLCSALITLAQPGTVKGRIIDARTYKPLPFATVYMNQTTLGTVTDDKGDFLMNSIPVGRYDLVVSYVGYQPYQTRVIVNDSVAVTVSIKMSASTTNLEEILVRGKKDSKWALLYEKFQNQFFGVSPYTAECKINNPWVLDFTEDSNGNLIATAALPLEIENLGLGYNITCQLKEFTVGPALYKINGTYRFSEAQTLDATLSELWHTRREGVYQGSTRHLLKAIVTGRVQEEGFDLYFDKSNNPEVIRNSNFLNNLNTSIVHLSPSELQVTSKGIGMYTAKFPARTEVHFLKKDAQPKVYRNVPYPVSWLEVSLGQLEISAEGVVMNPNRLTVAGAMGEAHISELLPLDYHPQAIIDDTKPATRKTYSKLAALLEKPYLMTDKPYYYAADAIMFKAYLNYISPVYRDSLSHVLNVELIDASQKIVYKKMYPLVGGSANGDFMLPVTTQPGDYTLRTYTRWMLNFDKQIIFAKSIKVLANDQLGTQKEFKPVVKNLQVLTEKDEFEPREKITLALEATNFYGYAVSADLAVSVTDIEQAAIPDNEATILTRFPFTKEMLPDSSLNDPKFLIQYGIDFKGQMVSGKKNKPAKGVLTVYQDNVDDVFGVPTDEAGKFHQQLQIMDSVELLIAAKTSKGKAAKVIVEEVMNPIPETELAAALVLDTYKPKDQSKYHVTDLFSTAKMLETVTVEAKKIERASADKKHLLTDAHIDGDYLRSTNATDLLSAIRGRVPGLIVLYFKDPETGGAKKFITFSGITSAAASGGYTVMQECLVEIDGVAINGSMETAAEQLSGMSVNDVESIDVLRFGSASAYGARAANGVIIVKTNLGEKSESGPRKLDRTKLQVIAMNGYSTSAEFESPDYSEHNSGDDRLDLRSTIYWNPFLVTDAKQPLLVSFYAADISTKYRIVVEGVTAEGEAVRGEKIIIVAPKK
jgi:TonB-dependent SusC/RagA subfamily outer membrane receptor